VCHELWHQPPCSQGAVLAGRVQQQQLLSGHASGPASAVCSVASPAILHIPTHHAGEGFACRSHSIGHDHCGGHVPIQQLLHLWVGDGGRGLSLHWKVQGHNRGVWCAGALTARCTASAGGLCGLWDSSRNTPGNCCCCCCCWQVLLRAPAARVHSWTAAAAAAAAWGRAHAGSNLAQLQWLGTRSERQPLLTMSWVDALYTCCWSALGSNTRENLYSASLLFLGGGRMCACKCKARHAWLR
jgi:hypothetical protein